MIYIKRICNNYTELIQFLADCGFTTEVNGNYYYTPMYNDRGTADVTKMPYYDINTTDDKTERKIHDKFSDDNMRKKCKNIVLKYAFIFINNKIKEKYNNDIGHGKFKKELKVINQENKINSTIKNDKLFLNKTLKEIFSEDISARLYNFPKNFNKILIESLIEEDNNEERKEYFNKLFNITFLDCLKYFREDNNFFINELSGFKRISDIKEELINKQGKEYVDMLIYYLKNFQEIINKKQARKNKTKKVGNI